MSTLNELAKEFKLLKEDVAAMEDTLKEYKAALAEAESALADYMLENDNKSFEWGGAKFIVTVKPQYTVLAEAREALLSALKLFGIERSDVVTETIPAQKLNSLMRGVLEENDGELPEELDGIVKVFNKKSVSLRRGA